MLGENHFQKYLDTIPLQARAHLFYKHARARAHKHTLARESTGDVADTRSSADVDLERNVSLLKTLWTR